MQIHKVTTEWIDSDSSDSSSSSSEDSEAEETRPSTRKKPRTTANVEDADEILIAFVTNVQHAMLPTVEDWKPYHEGKHYQAACGARLDTDRVQFSRDLEQGRSLCQRPACMKAWKSSLL